MKLTLDHQVAAAVGGILAGRESVTLEDVAQDLPPHIRSANPSLKSITKALASAGWIGARHEGGRMIYAPPGGSDPAAIGHNGGAVIAGIAADELRLLVERVMRLEDERKGIGDDIRNVFAEAKGRGFDPVAMRAIIKLMRKNPDERFAADAVLEVYLRAMGMMQS